MDLVKDDIKRLYRKYLSASIMSAVVMSIYSIVDSVAIGQSEGPAGSAALAVITPLYGIYAFLSILCGVGGAVLYSNAKGEEKIEKANAYFTNATAMMAVFVLLAWGGFALFHNPILTFFGADAELLPKVMEYAWWIIGFMPMFLLSMFISTFVRNDNAPGLAMTAVIIGGCINIFGDWFLVFPLGMGMKGAGIATVAGTTVQLIVLCTHFFTKKCSLKLVKPFHALPAICGTLITGFGTAVLDLGVVIIAILINNQIMRYGSTTALAVYGVVATISSLFQAIFNGVGQAIQPIVSANCGAGLLDRIKQTWKLAVTTVVGLGIVFTAVGMLFPTQMVRLFMDVTPEVIAAAPGIIRPYFLVFLFLGFNIAATYYLQSAMHSKMSMVVGILRSIAVSGLLVIVLPSLLDNILGVWLAMPIAELIVMVIALCYIRKEIRKGDLANGFDQR